ncbi:MAG: restriction endonuclease subunit S [Eggerthellaceae bacterium]|nr:restriction endonuclease subunit S [Eggerthellaceae bacterium]
MRVKLEDVCSSISDGDHNPPPKTTERDSVPFVTISNIQSEYGTLDLGETARVPLDYYESLADIRKPRTGDVIYSVVGSFGLPVLVRDDSPFVFQRHIAILRPRQEMILPEYLFYLMKSRDFYHWADKVAVGAAQRTVTLGSLRSKELHLPALEKQGVIVSVLSAYDSLIENNRKQIKLLEEAAQRLYKEWFIDLRFPGHESTPTNPETGLPEGWARGVLSDLVKEAGKRITVDQRNDFAHYLPIDSIPSKTMRSWISKNIEEAESSLLSFAQDDMLFGAMRPYFHKVMLASFSGITRSTCFVLRERNPLFHYYAYLLLYDRVSVEYATSRSIGTTMPYIRWADFASMPILVPDEEVVSLFAARIEPILHAADVRAKQLRGAAEARDRLLPKLMSEELEVL